MGAGGLGVTLSANKGKGKGAGNSTTYRNTDVGSLTGQTTITADNQLSLTGAQAIGKGVKVDAKSLAITSLQDTAQYDSKQNSIGGSLTVGAGVSVGGNFSKSNIHADHQAVGKQSGILAGDDGFQVDVENHTALDGVIITSSAAAEGCG